jgi:farnesyl-diphosphate farnesyltransferase
LWSASEVDRGALIRDGVRFGKGLQMVNILRDLPQDLRKGRCYVPSQSLKAAGLAPGDLLDAGNEARFRPVFDKLIAVAEGHLAAGWGYIKSLPKGQVRQRLGLAPAALIGVRTLRLPRGGPFSKVALSFSASVRPRLGRAVRQRIGVDFAARR